MRLKAYNSTAPNHRHSRMDHYQTEVASILGEGLGVATTEDDSTSLSLTGQHQMFQLNFNEFLSNEVSQGMNLNADTSESTTDMEQHRMSQPDPNEYLNNEVNMWINSNAYTDDDSASNGSVGRTTMNQRFVVVVVTLFASIKTMYNDKKLSTTQENRTKKTETRT